MNVDFLNIQKSESYPKSATPEITPIVGIGERSSGVHKQSLALAETFEAIIAAIYKDGGYEILKKLIVKWFNLPFPRMS